MGKSPFTMPGSGFYGKSNQSVSPGKYTASPMKADEKPMGSDQEANITDDRDYVDSSTGNVKTAAMERLERAKPPADSKGYAGWKAAYDKASKKQTDEFRARETR